MQYSRLDLVEIHRNDDQQPDECAMKLSLIICTRNRASSLTPCLQSIAKAHRRLNVDLVDVELIAVDNASSASDLRALRFANSPLLSCGATSDTVTLSVTSDAAL